MAKNKIQLKVETDNPVFFSIENQPFKAFVVEERDGKYVGSIQSRLITNLPEGDLLIKVAYSSLNYKDALSASGNRGVTKVYPHTPGIDAAGSIVHSKSGLFQIGDKVIVTGYDLGMNTAGGFGQYIRVPSEWAVKLPQSLSLKEAMIYGTAGLTAGISILKLSEQIKPRDGKIIVSGATGGVGALSIAILSKLGYSITAITGKETQKEYLLRIGANDIILRKDFEALDKKTLLTPAYAGAVDTTGGVILENIIKSTGTNGAVCCCGNVASPQLSLTVFPFILRGVSLFGIDSQKYPMKSREEIWHKLAHGWKPEHLAETTIEITLDELSDKIALMLQGKLMGRTIIKMPE